MTRESRAVLGLWRFPNRGTERLHVPSSLSNQHSCPAGHERFPDLVGLPAPLCSARLEQMPEVACSTAGPTSAAQRQPTFEPPRVPGNLHQLVLSERERREEHHLLPTGSRPCESPLDRPTHPTAGVYNGWQRLRSTRVCRPIKWNSSSEASSLLQ